MATGLDIATTVEIAAERRRVAAFVLDTSNAAAWYGNLAACRSRPPGPVVAGSNIEFDLRILGQRLHFDYEVEVHDPGALLRMRAAVRDLRVVTSYSWRDLGTGATSMCLRHTVDAGRVFGFAAPVLGAALRRANREDLDRLKHLIERNGKGTDGCENTRS